MCVCVCVCVCVCAVCVCAVCVWVYTGGVHQQATNKKCLRIALEGNIAAGKSTLLRLLEDELGDVCII